jgi:hypothetical protein
MLLLLLHLIHKQFDPMEHTPAEPSVRIPYSKGCSMVSIERIRMAPTLHPPRLLLCTPAHGARVKDCYLYSVCALRDLCMNAGIGLTFHTVGNESLLPRARNLMLAHFMSVSPSPSHLLFVDADIGFDAPDVLRMMEFDVPVLCGAYPRKSLGRSGELSFNVAPFPPPQKELLLSDRHLPLSAAERRGRDQGGLVRVWEAGGGFMMISCGCLRAMWSAYHDALLCVDDSPGTAGIRYVALFDCMICPRTRRYLSEDYAFCRRWNDMGGRVWVYPQCNLRHVGPTELSFPIAPSVPSDAQEASAAEFPPSLEGRSVLIAGVGARSGKDVSLHFAMMLLELQAVLSRQARMRVSVSCCADSEAAHRTFLDQQHYGTLVVLSVEVATLEFVLEACRQTAKSVVLGRTIRPNNYDWGYVRGGGIEACEDERRATCVTCRWCEAAALAEQGPCSSSSFYHRCFDASPPPPMERGRAWVEHRGGDGWCWVDTRLSGSSTHTTLSFEGAWCQRCGDDGA